MAVKDQTRPAWQKVKPEDPKRLSKLIEAAFELDTLRKIYTREAESVESEVKMIKALIIHDFDKADIREIQTRLGTARFVTKEQPVTDPDSGGWEATYAYIVQDAIKEFGDGFSSTAQDLFKKYYKKLAQHIAQHGFWDILQKRFGERACQSRWEEKQKIPGVKSFTKADIKLGDAE